MFFAHRSKVEGTAFYSSRWEANKNGLGRARVAFYSNDRSQNVLTLLGENNDGIVDDWVADDSREVCNDAPGGIYALWLGKVRREEAFEALRNQSSQPTAGEGPRRMLSSNMLLRLGFFALLSQQDVLCLLFRTSGTFVSKSIGCIALRSLFIVRMDRNSGKSLPGTNTINMTTRRACLGKKSGNRYCSVAILIQGSQGP
eukprot:3802387-Amphidinium_carterae.1